LIILSELDKGIMHILIYLKSELDNYSDNLSQSGLMVAERNHQIMERLLT